MVPVLLQEITPNENKDVLTNKKSLPSSLPGISNVVGFLKIFYWLNDFLKIEKIILATAISGQLLFTKKLRKVILISTAGFTEIKTMIDQRVVYTGNYFNEPFPKNLN